VVTGKLELCAWTRGGAASACVKPFAQASSADLNGCSYPVLRPPHTSMHTRAVQSAIKHCALRGSPCSAVDSGGGPRTGNLLPMLCRRLHGSKRRTEDEHAALPPTPEGSKRRTEDEQRPCRRLQSGVRGGPTPGIALPPTPAGSKRRTDDEQGLGRLRFVDLSSLVLSLGCVAWGLCASTYESRHHYIRQTHALADPCEDQS